MKRINKLTVMLALLLMICISGAAETTITLQTIRGHVSDVSSDEPMIGVTIVVEGVENATAVSDINGNFVINNVPVGRHTIKASYVGYESLIIKEQLLSAGKEMVLNLYMNESVSQLGEVVVKPQVNKQMPLNEMAQVGARMFSVEEANRYAGGLADPARTAAMFAGVASGASNGISIHGNSPQMLQWRIEGVEVNNPNHFADITGAGGGIFTSLNGTVLANSDFLTGAMPAEYGNALSGAFDMKMRVGNSAKHEHAFQIGSLGVDFASEGPLEKVKEGCNGASYLVNYRYSFLKIAQEMHAINMENQNLDYQDLSFKLNFPTRKAGTFALWFTGLVDNYNNDIADVSDWETLWDCNDSWSKQRSCAMGLTHTYRFRTGGTLRSSVAYTGSYTRVGVNDYDTQLNSTPNMNGRNISWMLQESVQHQHKFSSRYTMQNGIQHQHLEFSSWLDHISEVGEPMKRMVDSKGYTGLTRFYTSHKIAFSPRLSAVAGMNIMWFNLNNQWLFEPRVSVQYKTTPSSTIAIAYAMNSRRETTDTYFVQKHNDGVVYNPNEALGLTRSHHISLSFAQRLGDNAMLKIEPYWQYLFDVPVEQGSTYSIVNHKMFYQERALVNDGAGRNYGVDFTLERYLKNGFYGMITATLFKSEYRDAQGDWHSTRHDRRYITNILGGKEWMVGKERKNVFGYNVRLTMMGGERYTPVPDGMTYEDVMKRADKEIPEDTSHPFSRQLGMNVGYAFSVKYTINGKRVAHHFILDYLQIRAFQGQTFNVKSRELENQFTTLTFPNIAYRIEF
jgi:hypothetical protein